MLFALIIVLAIVAGVSIAVNIKGYQTLQKLNKENNETQRKLENSYTNNRKLHVGNRRLSEILRDRDATIRNMSVMMETSMDIPTEGEDESKWRKRILDRHRSVDTPAKPLEVSEDATIMNELINNSSPNLKKLLNVIEEKELAPVVPHFHLHEDGSIDQLLPLPGQKTDVLESQMATYLKKDAELSGDFYDVATQAIPEVSTGVHELAERMRGNNPKPLPTNNPFNKIPGSNDEPLKAEFYLTEEAKTSLLPVLEPMSLEEKKDS